MAGGTKPPSGKSQMAIGFLRDTGTDPPREDIGPQGFSREVRTEFSVSAHVEESPIWP